MNERLLQIYSFLMRHSVPFSRYCHAPCTTDEEWKAALKKMNIPCALVHTSLLSLPDGSVLFFLQELSENQDAAESPVLRGTEPFSLFHTEKILRSLCCDEHTLSPLSLVLGFQKSFAVAVSSVLRKSEYLCFPCGDNSESIIMRAADFLEHFAPAAGIKIIG